MPLIAKEFQKMNNDEIKRRFDGSHHKGTLTFVATGANARYQRINLFLETTKEEETTRVECQMTIDQALSLVEFLSGSIEHLSGRHN